MKRREALEKTGWILKSALVAPGVISFLHSCTEKVIEADNLLVLSGHEHRLLSSIADVLIPKTESPSATEVQVVEFLDLLLQDALDEDSKDRFISGLKEFDQACKSQTGSVFTELAGAQQLDYLTEIDQKVMSESYEDMVPFYYTFKQLCISIYFSTEQGIKQNLNYQPVPGSFQGDIALGAPATITVGNQM